MRGWGLYCPYVLPYVEGVSNCFVCVLYQCLAGSFVLFHESMCLWAFGIILWICTVAQCSSPLETSISDDARAHMAEFPPPLTRSGQHQYSVHPIPAGAQVVGDMVFVRPVRSGNKFGEQGVAYADTAQRWPVTNGRITVPFVLAATDGNVQERVPQAIEHWETKACVTFVDVTNVRPTQLPADYIEVTPVVGQQGGWRHRSLWQEAVYHADLQHSNVVFCVGFTRKGMEVPKRNGGSGLASPCPPFPGSEIG